MYLGTLENPWEGNNSGPFLRFSISWTIFIIKTFCCRSIIDVVFISAWRSQGNSKKTRSFCSFFIFSFYSLSPVRSNNPIISYIHKLVKLNSFFVFRLILTYFARSFVRLFSFFFLSFFEASSCDRMVAMTMRSRTLRSQTLRSQTLQKTLRSQTLRSRTLHVALLRPYY